MKKKYIEPRIIGVRIVYPKILAASGEDIEMDSENTVTTSDGVEAKTYKKIDLWADEVEEDMAYGH